MANFFVAVPCRNSERFIAHTLASVLEQDLAGQYVHLHIQDAESTDATIDIVRAFVSQLEASPQRQRLVVTYVSEADRGMYDAIGRGLKHWAGRYMQPDVFFWLNSDDVLMPNALQHLACDFADPSVKWVICEGIDIDENDAILHRKPHKRIPIEQLQSGDFNYSGGDWLRAESTAVRFELIQFESDLDPALRLAGDYRLFMQLARRVEPHYFDHPLRAFRKHDSQLSKAAIQYQHERSRIRFFKEELAGAKDAPPAVDLARAEVVYYPDYSSGNSYQLLLYAGVRAHSAATLDELCQLAQAHPGAVLHVHWLNQIVRLQREQAMREAAKLRVILEGAKSRGQKVVFTVHNIASHEGENRDIEEDLVEHLFAVADVVHIHHPVVALQIQQRYKSFPWGRIVIAEHGAYPASRYAGRGSMLRLFGVDNDTPFCVIPGQIRGYKDIDFQVALMRRLTYTGILPGRLNLLLAGVVHPEVGQKQRRALGAIQGVHLATRRLDDAEFSSVLHHAEFVLLCYRDISTSGSLFHALSVGTPVVAPSLGTIPSYVFEGYNGALYVAGDIDSCVSAQRRLLSARDKPDLRMQAARSVAHLEWSLTLSKILAKVM